MALTSASQPQTPTEAADWAGTKTLTISKIENAKHSVQLARIKLLLQIHHATERACASHTTTEPCTRSARGVTPGRRPPHPRRRARYATSLTIGSAGPLPARRRRSHRRRARHAEAERPKHSRTRFTVTY